MSIFSKKKDIETKTGNDQENGSQDQSKAPETKEKSGGLKNLLIGLGVGAAAAGGAAWALFKGRKAGGYSEVDGPYEDDDEADQVDDSDFEEE